MKKAEL